MSMNTDQSKKDAGPKIKTPKAVGEIVDARNWSLQQCTAYLTAHSPQAAKTMRRVMSGENPEGVLKSLREWVEDYSVHPRMDALVAAGSTFGERLCSSVPKKEAPKEGGSKKSGPRGGFYILWTSGGVETMQSDRFENEIERDEVAGKFRAGKPVQLRADHDDYTFDHESDSLICLDIDASGVPVVYDYQGTDEERGIDDEGQDEGVKV